jgi:hypothetical protein
MALSLFAGAAEAQEITLGFYLVPKVGAGTSPLDAFRPKYIGDFGTALDPMVPKATLRPSMSAMDLGIEPTFLVGAFLTAAQHTFVTAQSDVFAFPALDVPVGGNPTLNRTRNELEQRNIPGSWIQAATTWRQVIGEIGRNCIILQRLQGRHQRRLFEPGVSLDSLPSQDLLTQLASVGTSLGLSVTGLSIVNTVRANLMVLTAQILPFGLAGEMF